jgi:hypothetical protein
MQSGPRTINVIFYERDRQIILLKTRIKQKNDLYSLQTLQTIQELMVVVSSVVLRFKKNDAL